MRKEIFVGALLGAIMGVLALIFIFKPELIDPTVSDNPDTHLNQYSIPSLRKTRLKPSEVTLGDDLDYGDTTKAKTFTFIDSIAQKKVSGVLTLPEEAGKYPVIIMLRGYADKEIYHSGLGTQRGATELAKNGYITLAPDFLGYGSSDSDSFDSMEARFQTYTTVLSLLESLDEVTAAFERDALNYEIDTSHIGMWGHSNGGQIAMSVLAITGEEYPTTLWAPVSKQFPDSILEFADEMDDGGKYLRNLVRDFDTNYNLSLFTFTNYLHWVKAPIQIHQGSDDESVPIQWSRDFSTKLQDENIEATYFEYQGEDHNFRQGSFDVIMKRDLEFFERELD